MGDSWSHVLVVEKVIEVTGTVVPRCIAGARACPPEDCGGAWGYAELIAALADPAHEDHRHLREWVDQDWSPDAFDLDRADRLVARHAPHRGRPRGRARR